MHILSLHGSLAEVMAALCRAERSRCAGPDAARLDLRATVMGI